MKKHLLLLLAAACAGFASFAEDTAPAEEPIRGPRIFCEEPEFNFGTADNQTQIEHTFIFKNIGDTTLEISNVRAACGCTVANIEPKTVPPGGESRLTARLNLQGRTGHQAKSINIMSNDPQQPDYRVAMVGIAQAAFQVTPDKLMLGQVGPGQEVNQALEIRNLGPDSFSILNIETSMAEIKAVSETIEENRHYRINVSLGKVQNQGPINGNIRVFTDHPSRPVIDIPVFGSVIGELVYAPAEIRLPANSDGKPMTRYVVIRPGALAQFQITAVELPSPEMTSSLFPFGTQGYRIQLDGIVSSPDLAGKSIVIKTTSGQMPEINIPLILE